MSISERIDKQKALLIDKAINSYKENGRGLSTALKLMKNDIQKMRDEGLSLKQQIDILDGIFDVKIKYDTYKKWSQRHFKKVPEVENKDTKKVVEITKKETPVQGTKTDTKKNEKVAQKSEPKINKTVDLNKPFVRKTKPKFDKGML